MDNKFIKFLASTPVILITLYFLPFLGICLILLRYFIYVNNPKKKTNLSVYLIVIGFILLVPKLINKVFDLIKININKIPYFTDIINSTIYKNDLIKYSKRLITVGIIFLILSFVLNKVINRISSSLKSKINSKIIEEEKRNAEIYQKNDLIMKEKRERAQNTTVVYCPYCGADNMLTSNTGTCKFCRRQISAKK